ncbi:DUF3077 domain-containing protein [Pseudomonas sp. BP8]|uniref:DUF3077 domain-containing protein n=1 Tax=Pseudomonas sp. BP8 TaxID=2817864 RepID=UPI001AE5ED8A|nr:DUF3077 domain-containing protein [Pseudomonas sp. BP8]MBP2263062.1 hypothetical protein [Pseudomonas sp. BP8]HDS1736890.1 DUF3077 domain-containing protein [Pseudomonas putida]
MPKDEIVTGGSECNPDHRYGPSRRLFTSIPGIPTAQAKEQASKLIECARYLNHTGVMLGDHRMVVASHHLNAMVRVLVDQLEDERPQS